MNHMITFKRVFVEKSTDLAIDTLSSGLKSIRFLPQWISDIWETFYFYGVAIIICLFLAFHISSINGLLCVWREVVDVIGSIIAILTFGSAQLDKLVSFRLRWAYVSLLTQMDNITYISRLGLEKQLNRALFGKLIPISSKVTVLYGAKGAGKTTCLNRIISDKYGVLYLSVTDVTLKEDILRDVAKLPYLKEASVVQALNAAPFTGSMIPVIVFDVELSQSNLNDASVLGLVAGLAKNFSRAARVIVVVSDANAAQMFNTDAYRREFIHVGELLEDEAAQMCVKLDDLYSLINKDDLLYVFQRIGTRPSMLVDLYDRTTTGKVLNAREYADDMVSLARCQLLAFRHQIIIRMLKLKPAGVPVSDLRDKYDGTINLTDPKEVGPALKMSEAVLYHIESREYRAQSRAHLTALAELVYD